MRNAERALLHTIGIAVLATHVTACIFDIPTDIGWAAAGGSVESGPFGSAGEGGSGGAPCSGGNTDASPKADGGSDCATPSISHVAPAVPTAIETPAGVTLIGGFHAEGNQIYTCTASADAGSSAGSWVNTAAATLFGDDCAVVAHHSFAPGPTWTAEDRSVVKASKAAAAPAPSDAGAAIAWVLLKATATTGTGLFSDVTYVQRVDTAGGVGPSGSCDPSSVDAGAVSVPYSATYYFYTGGNLSDAGAN